MGWWFISLFAYASCSNPGKSLYWLNIDPGFGCRKKFNSVIYLHEFSVANNLIYSICVWQFYTSSVTVIVRVKARICHVAVVGLPLKKRCM